MDGWIGKGVASEKTYNPVTNMWQSMKMKKYFPVSLVFQGGEPTS